MIKKMIPIIPSAILGLAIGIFTKSTLLAIIVFVSIAVLLFTLQAVLSYKNRYMRGIWIILSLIASSNSIVLNAIIAYFFNDIIPLPPQWNILLLLLLVPLLYYFAYLDAKQNGLLDKPKDKVADIEDSPEAHIDQRGKGLKDARIKNSKGANIKQ